MNNIFQSSLPSRYISLWNQINPVSTHKVYSSKINVIIHFKKQVPPAFFKRKIKN